MTRDGVNPETFWAVYEALYAWVSLDESHDGDDEGNDDDLPPEPRSHVGHRGNAGVKDPVLRFVMNAAS